MPGAANHSPMTLKTFTRMQHNNHDIRHGKRRYGILLATCILIMTSLLFCFTSCQDEFPATVMSALRKARGNRASLEKMLRHYKECGDEEKYQAACFLVSAMPYHQQVCRIKGYDKRVDSLCRASRNAYYALTWNATVAEQDCLPLNQTLHDSAHTASMRADSLVFSSPEVCAEIRPDIETLNGNFIAAHIEHAFMLRRTVERIRRLPFAVFCEYVLPYRAMGHYPLVVSARNLYEDYSRFMRADTATNLTNIMERYNRSMCWIRR